MIPKTIHYCWFGGADKDQKTLDCLASWKRILTDYDIIEWNETNFNINANDYVREAYAARKWAFVADYARLWVLKEYGGIYLDADVEAVKTFDDLLGLHAFTCFEYCSDSRETKIEAGVIGSEKGGRWITEMLKVFDNERFFLDENGDTGSYNTLILPVRLSKRTKEIFGMALRDTDRQFICNDVSIFDCSYFSPKNPKTDRIERTEHTHAVHHFNNSWVSPYAYQKLRWKYYNRFGKRMGIVVFAICHPIKAVRVYKLFKTGKEPKSE